MSLPAIGVVIPCYKAEHTLRQTVESVLQGAPDNLQLVLVEDGSPDGTGALCDALAAQDPRVTALHQPNGGASAARNAGLDTLCRSGAEWVLFVDADDDDRLMRVMARDISERGKDVRWVIERYSRTVKPMYLQFIEPSKRYADIIIPQGGHNKVAIDIITNTIEKSLKDRLGK